MKIDPVIIFAGAFVAGFLFGSTIGVLIIKLVVR